MIWETFYVVDSTFKHNEVEIKLEEEEEQNAHEEHPGTTHNHHIDYDKNEKAIKMHSEFSKEEDWMIHENHKTHKMSDQIVSINSQNMIKNLNEEDPLIQVRNLRHYSFSQYQGAIEKIMK